MFLINEYRDNWRANFGMEIPTIQWQLFCFGMLIHAHHIRAIFWSLANVDSVVKMTVCMPAWVTVRSYYHLLPFAFTILIVLLGCWMLVTWCGLLSMEINGLIHRVPSSEQSLQGLGCNNTWWLCIGIINHSLLNFLTSQKSSNNKTTSVTIMGKNSCQITISLVG